jgi:hypothetical protein
MTPPTLHLLTLPREIREIIYGFLAEDKNFKYQWSENSYAPNHNRDAPPWSPLGPAIPTEVIVQVPRFPPTNVLLTHPRVKDEAQ